MLKNLVLSFIFFSASLQLSAATIECKAEVRSEQGDEQQAVTQLKYLFDAESGYLLNDEPLTFDNGDTVQAQITYFSFPNSSPEEVDVFAIFSFKVMPANATGQEEVYYTTKRIQTQQQVIPFSTKVSWKGGVHKNSQTDSYTAKIRCEFK